MSKFRKKPVEIEAFAPTDQNGTWPAWALEAEAAGILVRQPGPEAVWKVTTLEGEHISTAGDYLIRGVKGELYFCKPDIFAETYDAVDEARQQFSEADFA